MLGVTNPPSNALKSSGTIATKSTTTTNIPATPTHGHGLPLPPVIPQRTVIITATISKQISSNSSNINIVPVDYEDSENMPPSRISNSSTASRDSDITEFTQFTSMTEIKERKISTDSHTIVREV